MSSIPIHSSLKESKVINNGKLNITITSIDGDEIPAEDRLIYVQASGIIENQYYCYNHSVPLFPELYKPKGMLCISKNQK